MTAILYVIYFQESTVMGKGDAMLEYNLTTILEQLEGQLDLNHAREVERLHLDAIHFRRVSRIPLSVEYPADPGFPRLPFREVFRNPEKMLYNELVTIKNNIWNSIQIRDDFPLQIRPNYGIGLISSLFGAQIRVDDWNAPWVLHMEEEKAFRDAVSHGVPDLKGGLFERVLETYEVFTQLLQPYPKCAEAIRLTQPDMQGPFCNLQLIRGDQLFYDLYDDPDMIHEALDVITDTMISCQQALPTLNDKAGEEAHYILFGIYRGGFLIKLDTETATISEDMYEEFCAPYNQKLLKAAGGGAAHFCGGGKSWPARRLPDHDIYTLNFGNPEMQDLLVDWADARTKKISAAAYGWGQPYSFLRRKMEQGLCDGVTFLTRAESREEAKQILNAHREWCAANL